ncbi:MAG: pantetheine-phosphate adenylyltransferase [Clostridia bacterium]|nr:pantetheine-phosphate adenylyltransferase [Clostridia bacterium]
MKKCVFAGTFDPPTQGHRAVVETCLKIFDEVVVAVMVNTAKTPFLTVEERVYLLKKLFGEGGRVKVISFYGAAVDLLKQEDTVFYVRGVRNTVDFEYENADYFASKKLMPELVEVYIPAPQDILQVSSTLVKNSVKFGKDYSAYIPQEIADDMKKLLEGKNV